MGRPSRGDTSTPQSHHQETSGRKEAERLQELQWEDVCLSQSWLHRRDLSRGNINTQTTVEGVKPQGKGRHCVPGSGAWVSFCPETENYKQVVTAQRQTVGLSLVTQDKGAAMKPYRHKPHKQTQQATFVHFCMLICTSVTK